MRRWLLGGWALGAAGAAVHLDLSACAPEPPATTYGNPNTLDRKNIPGEGGTEPLACGGDPDGGGGGGASFDGGCPSFATDIYPLLTPAGSWKCGDALCHAPGKTAPIIDTTSPQTCLAALRNITVGGQPYLAEAGTFVCNLQGTCGSKMPKPPGTDPTPIDLCKVDAWLKCGAPP